MWQDYDYKKRKRKYEEERAQRDAAFNLHIAHMREIATAVAQQKQDHPAITVPVTRCDRQERRRVLKLED